MDDLTIIGGGFSAFLAKLLLGDKANILTSAAPNNLEPYQLKRRKVLEVNKFFTNKGYSTTRLKPSFKNLRLHDRLVHGGNSNIWGGMIDARKLPKSITRALNGCGVSLQELSLKKTGTVSSNLGLAQLLDSSGKILDVSHYLNDSNNNFLESFFVEEDRIGLRIINADDENSLKTIYTKNLILCVGVVQTIDLLYRSGFLKDGDKINLSEFGHKRSLKLTLHPEIFKAKNDEITVRYDTMRAACHFLGIQKRPWISNISQYIPLFVDQKFTLANSKYHLKIMNGTLCELQSNAINNGLNSPAYGGSIHYCDMSINNHNANKFINNISPRLTGIGMAFTAQAIPGPISNDICLDALSKINKLR